MRPAGGRTSDTVKGRTGPLLECGGKRSATPLWLAVAKRRRLLASALFSQSAVAAALGQCLHPVPKISSRNSKPAIRKPGSDPRKVGWKCCLPFPARARQGSPRLVDSLSLSGHVKSSGEHGSVTI